VRALRAAGVEVVGALPPSLLLRADLLYHRKIPVLDGRAAYTGSQNLADPRFFKQSAGVGPWVDAVLRVEGPAISQLAAMFELDWAMEAGTSFAAPRTWTESISTECRSPHRAVSGWLAAHQEAGR
jgi:cardiolipin synthase